MADHFGYHFLNFSRVWGIRDTSKFYYQLSRDTHVPLMFFGVIEYPSFACPKTVNSLTVFGQERAKEKM